MKNCNRLGCGVVACAFLLAALLGLAGCGVDPQDPRWTAWQEIEKAKANAKAEIEKARAEHPRVSKITLEPLKPGEPVVFTNGKLQVEIAHTEGNAPPVDFPPTPPPKSDFEVGVEAFKSAPGDVVRGVLGYKAAEVGGEVLGKALDRAGDRIKYTDVGNVKGDMNSTVKAGSQSPVQGAGVTGPRDPMSIITGGE